MEPIKQFKQTIEIKHYSKETHKSYKFHIDRFRKYYDDNITKENIMRHLHYLTKKEYSPSTINITRAALLYYANKIIGKEINPKEIETIKRVQPLPRPVNQEIIVRILNNTKNLKHRILIEILYGSGVRLGEVVKIEWNDIDFVNKTLRINRGKGMKDRLTRLGDNVIQHLFDYKESRYNKGSPYVFDSQARPHTYISKKTVQKVLENGSNKAGIEPIVTPHILRHSFATHSLEYGMDIRKIQEVLGHSSPKTTMIYTRVSKKTISEMISPLDKLDFNQVDGGVKSNSSFSERKVISNTKRNC